MVQTKLILEALKVLHLLRQIMWYRLTAKEQICSDDPVKGLDVSILQDYLLSPILGIEDPKTDDRIDFIGGIRGLEEADFTITNKIKSLNCYKNFLFLDIFY